MEVVVTTGAIRRAKLQSNRHHQQTNTQLSTGRMPFLSPNQQCQSTEGNPSSPGGLPTLSLTTNSCWLPWGGLPHFLSALWRQYLIASPERQNYYTDYSNIDAVGWMTPALADDEVLRWATFGRSGLTRSDFRPKQKPKLTVLVVVV